MHLAQDEVQDEEGNQSQEDGPLDDQTSLSKLSARVWLVTWHVEYAYPSIPERYAVTKLIHLVISTGQRAYDGCSNFLQLHSQKLVEGMVWRRTKPM
jgi:hypothetical protein